MFLGNYSIAMIFQGFSSEPKPYFKDLFSARDVAGTLQVIKKDPAPVWKS